MPAETRAVRQLGPDEEAPARARVISLPNDFSPRAYQLPVMRYLMNGGKRAVITWPRRHGKDLTWLHIHAYMSQKRVGAYWHCLPTYAQAKKTVWDAFRRDGKPMISNAFPREMLAKEPNESTMMLHLKNGSTFQLIGADRTDTIVGSGPVGLSFSEYALTRPGSWDLLRPVLIENDGWAGFLSTPRGRNHFWKLSEMARTNPTWFHQHLTIETAGVLDVEKTLAEARAEGVPEEIIRQEYFCDFNAALIGSVWGDLFEVLEQEGRLQTFEHPNDGVYTSWDLGIADATAIWFWRVRGDGVEFIDHLEDSGKPLSFFLDELERKPYAYVRHYLPHDARARTLVSGVSVQDEMTRKVGPNKVAIVPHLSLPDGIQATRRMLQSPKTRFHPRCDTKPLANDIRPFEAIRNYHYEWDEDSKVLAKKPLHDWSSHTADALRMAGVVAKMTLQLERKDPPPEKPIIPSMNKAFNLEDLFEQRERDRRN
jgi:hypothetical protein